MELIYNKRSYGEVVQEGKNVRSTSNKKWCPLDARDEDWSLVFDPIYKGDTTMVVSLETATDTPQEEIVLLTTILEDGKKDRVFVKLLTKTTCPTSKEFYSWAIERAEAKVKGKLRKGYTATKGEEGYKEPMRYIDWADRSPQPEGKMYIVEPKLNGVRCVAYPSGDLVSRGNVIYDQPHISSRLRGLGLTHPLDCEIYTHGKPFGWISGAVRRGKEADLELWVFDVVDLESTYEDRYANLLKLSVRFGSDTIKRVPALVTDDPFPLMDKFVGLGYEGGVVGDPKGMWVYDRTKYKWKLKPVYEEEFRICDVLYDELPEGQCIKFQCATGLGKRFEVVPSWDRKTRAERYYEWAKGNIDFMGKPLTVEYRGLSKSGIPTHGVGKVVRDYE